MIGHITFWAESTLGLVVGRAQIVVGVAGHHARAVPVQIVALSTHVGYDTPGRAPATAPGLIAQDLPHILFLPLSVAQGSIEILGIYPVLAHLVHYPVGLCQIKIQAMGVRLQ